MKTKPNLSFWQIWNMSFGFFGIQFGFALQNANVSRIFETLGANIEDIPILWIAAPVTGLIVQPIIGHMSDKTWGKLGRRRPYFLVGAILASLALLIMPNSPALWVAAGMLWIMDASINISMEPFRAFVGDMLPARQRTTGFAMQSFFIGTGAVIASALPYMLTNWLGMENIAGEAGIPDSVKWSFYVGAFVFLSAVLWTVISSKEYSPEEMKAFEEAKEQSKGSAIIENNKLYNKIGGISFLIGLVFSFLFYFLNYEKELYIFSFGLIIFGLIEFLAGYFYNKKKETGFLEVITAFNMMPKTMVQLAFVQFFSWFALFAMWIYSTAGITSHIYDMKVDMQFINTLENSLNDFSSKVNEDKIKDIQSELDIYKEKLTEGAHVALSMKVANFFLKEKQLIADETVKRLIHIEKEYNDGANWVGVGFSVYNGAAAILAFFLMFLAKITNRKIAHSFSLLVGGLSFISIYFITNPNLLLIPFVGIGLAWASILAMPYAILTGALPQDKMGTYMGIFNFFIVIPQILAASLLGFFVKQLFAGEAIYALLLGGISMIIAALLVVFVNDKD
ncbi:MAG: MFS transporter [Bacteroidales bacterium]|nr:MFS transporter [Bacteroidales bacterium]